MIRLSKLFWPVVVTPKEAVVKNVGIISRSQRLMTELGLIKPASNGTFHITPIAQRSLDKAIHLMNRSMRFIGGQKLSLPILTPSALWKKSGRLEGEITEFFMLNDRHGKEFLLSPTHEESITAMLGSSAPISYRQLPLLLYQIGPKFRDELKARFGLMRAKEFLMKDLYTFDRDMSGAQETYKNVNDCYAQFFKQLNIPIVKVEASTGIMGGSISHEYHLISQNGEDHILQCSDCDYAINEEVSSDHNQCPKCNGSKLIPKRGIEVAHCFVLGDKYSIPLKANFINEHGITEPLVMGCYGIGLTRLLAAILEVLSTDNELRWPALLAPFDVCVIGPKQGSKEQQCADIVERDMLRSLVNICGLEEVINDDRKYLTIGKRLMDAKRMGYPLIVVVGAKSVGENPKVELHINNNKLELEANQVLKEVVKYNEWKSQLTEQSSSENSNVNITDSRLYA